MQFDKLPKIKDINVKGKTVFLRADLDAPLEQGIGNSEKRIEITDDTRLVAAMETIEFLQKQGAKIIIAGHIGRPETKNHESRIMNHALSLEPIALWLQKKLGVSSEKLAVTKVGEFDGCGIAPDITVLENLRFYPGEKANDVEFAKKLAGLADIYVDDAFAVCHRSNASMVAITKFLPHYAGLHLQKEVTELSTVLQNPKRPLVVLVGGEKVETKLPLVSKMHGLADYVLVGGKIVEDQKKMIEEQHRNVSPATDGKKSVLLVAEMTADESDITEASTQNFLQIISLAKTIVWNGPMGIIEEAKGAKATEEIARAIAKSSSHSIVGGGNTVGFLKKIGIADKFSFLSTGGGAMLSFLSGENLPGLEALLCHAGA